MKNLTDVRLSIKSYLKSSDQPFEFNKKKAVFKFSTDANSEIKKLIYYIFLTDEGYCIVTDFDLKITKETAGVLSMYLHRINYYLYYGSFVLDFNNRQVYCQNFTNCIGIIPSRKMIEESILSIKEQIDKFGDIIVGITKGRNPSEEYFEKLLAEELEKEY